MDLAPDAHQTMPNEPRRLLREGKVPEFVLVERVAGKGATSPSCRGPDAWAQVVAQGWEGLVAKDTLWTVSL